jgi:hypothetical protein
MEETRREEKYLKGVLRLDRARFEDKMDRRKKCRILTECWREKKKKYGEKGERKILSGKRVCQ